ncbi:MAG: ABC transporter substrate-binding protein, partial [Desulfobacterota bacterium]|nr:ABC transporter substrate-binding protein [Thermodesulfobacteriota bacterium]
MKQGVFVCITAILFMLCATVLRAEQEPIKIGCLFDLSGPAGHIGTPSKYVAEMLAERLNKAGGVNGRQIKLVFGDAESNPGKATIEAKRLIENEQVVALIGPTRTDSAMAIINLVEASRTPNVGCVGGTPPVSPVRPYVFKSPQKTVTAVEKVYQYLNKQGIHKIAIITATDGFGKEGEQSLKELAGMYNITIIADEKFDVTDVDMTVQLTKIKATKAQALVCWTIGPPGAIVAKNVKQLSFTIPLIQCHGLPDPKYIELAGDAAEGTIMPSTKLMVADQLPDSDPQKKLLLDFINEYENVRKYGKVNTHSGYAWDALMLVVNAIKTAGTDKAKIRDAIERTKNYVGISGVYNMSPDDHCGLAVDSMVMIKV